MADPVAISFLVPSYNPGAYLEAAIESIVDQLEPGDEVLVQDGGSTDGSIEAIVARFGDQPWLDVRSEPDDGQSDALQRALERASNEYFMWLNADDIVYPGALEAVRAGLAEDHPDLLAGRSTIFQNDGRIVRTDTPGPITREAFVGLGSDLFTGSVAYRADFVRSAGGFDAKYEYCMDVDLFARMAEKEPQVTYIPELVAGLRWHAESKGGSTLWPIVREATEIRLAHARSTRERCTAITASTLYLVAGLAQPIRHSRWYSSARSRMAGTARQRHVPAP